MSVTPRRMTLVQPVKIVNSVGGMSAIGPELKRLGRVSHVCYRGAEPTHYEGGTRKVRGTSRFAPGREEEREERDEGNG